MHAEMVTVDPTTLVTTQISQILSDITISGEITMDFLQEIIILHILLVRHIDMMDIQTLHGLRLIHGVQMIHQRIDGTIDHVQHDGMCQLNQTGIIS